MKGLQWMAAALMAALLLLGTMSAAAAGPAAPSEAMARAENGDVIVTWAPPPASNIIVQTGCTASTSHDAGEGVHGFKSLRSG